MYCTNLIYNIQELTILKFIGVQKIKKRKLIVSHLHFPDQNN